MDLDYRNNSSCFDSLFYIFLKFYALKFATKDLTLIQHAKQRASKFKIFLSKFLVLFPMTKRLDFDSGIQDKF